MRQEKVRIIGLTGQTGAGKTAASDFLKSCGYAIINCDLVSKEVTNNSKECLNELVLEFSDIILLDNKKLNRKKLGEIVFSNKEKLLKLNEIIFPYILKSIEENIEKYRNEGFLVIVLDAPTLFESGADKLCDLIIGIIADEDIRKNRIMKRDNISFEQANNRINSQHDSKFFKENCDYYVENNSDLLHFNNAFKKLYSYIQGEIPWL